MSLFPNFQFFYPNSCGTLKRVVLVFATALLLPPVGGTTGDVSDSLGKSVELADGPAATIEPVTFQGTDGNAQVQELAQEPVQEGTLKKAGDLFERAKNTTGETAMGAKDWVQDKIGGASDATSAAAQKAGNLLKQAKDTTGETAMEAKDWMQDKIGGATDATSAAAQDTLQWATDTFESLKSQGLTTANDTSEWLSQDWKNMESWEYTILAFGQESDEAKTEKLNTLGKNGWECYHVSDSNAGQKFYLKKRKESFLCSKPASRQKLCFCLPTEIQARNARAQASDPNTPNLTSLAQLKQQLGRTFGIFFGCETNFTVDVFAIDPNFADQQKRHLFVIVVAHEIGDIKCQRF